MQRWSGGVRDCTFLAERHSPRAHCVMATVHGLMVLVGNVADFEPAGSCLVDPWES